MNEIDQLTDEEFQQLKQKTWDRHEIDLSGKKKKRNKQTNITAKKKIRK